LKSVLVRTPTPKRRTPLDIRSDLDHIDYPGIDIAHDEWPLDDESVDQVRAHHVLEHIPPHRIGYIWRELDRVLVPGGKAIIELPHTNSWAAATDMTHYGTGGTTPEVASYFNDGKHEQYWPDLDWQAEAWADMQFPTILRGSLRLKRRVQRPHLSHEVMKIPFVDAVVQIRITKRE
jgi:SAM-dependent methyltransferase